MNSQNRRFEAWAGKGMPPAWGKVFDVSENALPVVYPIVDTEQEVQYENGYPKPESWLCIAFDPIEQSIIWHALNNCPNDAQMEKLFGFLKEKRKFDEERKT